MPEILNAIWRQNLFRPVCFKIQEYDPEIGICNTVTISSEGNYQRWNRICGAWSTVADGLCKPCTYPDVVHHNLCNAYAAIFQGDR